MRHEIKSNEDCIFALIWVRDETSWLDVETCAYADAAFTYFGSHRVATQREFVAGYQPKFRFWFGETELGHILFVEALVPLDSNGILCLRLLHGFVVVRLELHQGTKNVLVLVSIFIPQQNGVRLVVST